jgi:hypothetical protein
MKKLCFLILFISQIGFSQSVPDEFKISASINLSNVRFNYQTDNFRIGYGIRSSYTTSPILSNFISDILVIGDTIWFGTGRGVAKTFDDGNTFYNYYGSQPFLEDDVSGIAVYNSWVVVSTAYSQTIGENTFPTGTGIKVSSDYGITWNAYPQPIDPQDDDTIFYGISKIYALPITVDENNLSYDILITKKNLTSDSLVIWITSWAGMLRKSTDYGRTFQRVVLPPDNLDSIYPGGGPYTFELNPRDPPQGNNNHKAFSVCAENDSTIYVGTANGINKSTDWGVSWRKFNNANTGNGISGDFVVALKIQRYNNKTIIWAASNSTGGSQFNGFSYSSNSGLTWASTLEEAVFSHNMGFKDSIVYLATDNGIWRSFFKPPNFTWSRPSAIYDEETKDQVKTNFFYSADSKGIFTWIGSGDGLARTTDTTVSPWTGKWKIFRAVKKLASTNETYAAPNPFSPKDEVTRIFFKTGKTSSKITIKIFDFGMNYVRTLLQNAQRSDPDELWTMWDGKRDDGRQVANGVYFYRIEIDDSEVVWGKILVMQ